MPTERCPQGGESTGYTEGARVYNDANISLGNDTDTLLTFNSELYDTDTIHDTGTNPSRLTCKTAGKYIISGNVEITATGTTIQVSIFIKLNNTTDIGRVNSLGLGTPASRLSITTIYDLAVNDYVELYALAGTSGKNAIAAAHRSPEFMMQRIG